MARIDRHKHGIDVVERVFGPAQEDVDERNGRLAVIAIDVRPGAIASTVVATHTIVGGLAPPDNEER
jgi:hypothetical protein